ncbi:hypothetical protein MRX96_042104 [Rhipicephalus microplus]
MSLWVVTGALCSTGKCKHREGALCLSVRARTLGKYRKGAQMSPAHRNIARPEDGGPFLGLQACRNPHPTHVGMKILRRNAIVGKRFGMVYVRHSGIWKDVSEQLAQIVASKHQRQ